MFLVPSRDARFIATYSVDFNGPGCNIAGFGVPHAPDTTYNRNTAFHRMQDEASIGSGLCDDIALASSRLWYLEQDTTVDVSR
jgi:hypothetical protein